MVLVKRKSGKGLASVPIKFRPYRGQLTEIDTLAAAYGKGRPEIARELIDEALKARRLKAVGKDEATEAVVLAQRKVVTEALAPLLAEVAGVRAAQERAEARMIDEFEHSAVRLKFLTLAARFVVVEVMVARQLLRDYVHTAYKVLVERAAKKTDGIEANFARRLAGYREEAERALDDITESGVEGLHEMAGRPNVFADETVTADAGAAQRGPER